MDTEEVREELFRLPVRLTTSKEFKNARDWDEDEIEDIVDLMVEAFNKHSMKLFYRNGGIIFGIFFLLDIFVMNVPIEALGMVLIMYGAILAGYSIHGPYRIAIEGLDSDERYELVKREMARDSMLITMGAIYFVAGFHLQIISSVW